MFFEKRRISTCSRGGRAHVARMVLLVLRHPCSSSLLHRAKPSFSERPRAKGTGVLGGPPTQALEGLEPLGRGRPRPSATRARAPLGRGRQRGPPRLRAGAKGAAPPPSGAGKRDGGALSASAAGATAPIAMDVHVDDGTSMRSDGQDHHG